MKKITILLIVLMVISVGFLSGCEEVQNSSTHENIEIVNYEINQKNFGAFGDGIEVTGTAKNNANYMQTVTIEGRLYDSNNKYVGNNNDYWLSKKVSGYSVPSGYSWDFILVYTGDFITGAKSIKFDISVS